MAAGKSFPSYPSPNFLANTGDVYRALLKLIQLHNQQEIGVQPAIEEWDEAIEVGRKALGMEAQL
jgi:hypothetical protein